MQDEPMDKKDFCGHSHLPGNVFESMTDAVYLIDPHSSRIVDANRAAYESLGMTRNEVIDQSVLSLNKDVIGLDQWQAIAAEILKKGGFTFAGRHKRKDGSDFPVEIVTDVTEIGGQTLLLSVARDMSHYERHRDYLTDNDHIRTLLLNESSDGLWDWNVVDNTLFLSRQWFRMLGYGPNEIEHPTLDTWRDSVHPDDLERVIGLLQSHMQGKTSRYEAKYRLRSRDGSYRWVHDRGSVAERDDQGHACRVIGLVLDITESQQYAEQLLRHSRHDDLTGLHNRRAGYELFETYLAQSRERGAMLQVVMFDLDHFKRLNDLHGHQNGDRAIQHFAHILQGELRESDLFFRWGGEEFLLLLPETGRVDAVALVRRLLSCFSESRFVSDNGETIQLTCSAGIASYPQEGDSIRALVSAADKAMYRAKQAGRNRVA